MLAAPAPPPLAAELGIRVRAVPVPPSLRLAALEGNSFRCSSLLGCGLALAFAASAERGGRWLRAPRSSACRAAAGGATASRTPCKAVASGRRAAGTSALGGCLLAALGPSGVAAADGAELMRRGMEAFKEFQVDGSIKLFDDAASAGYPKAMLWQRGLSLYYADRFEDGASQFRKDVEMNPNDTEESIWAMLCEAQLFGFEEARKRMLAVGRDSRRVMRTVYAMFRGEDEAANVKALEMSASNGGSDGFYSALYLGLLAEAKGQRAEAERWIAQAVASKYAKVSGDYMADLARVHQKVRGWAAPSAEL